MKKILLEPNTALYPVPVVLVTCGDRKPNVFVNNRIASVAAEPPVIAMGLRPQRYSSDLILRTREFVVNLPTESMEDDLNFVGTTTARKIDKWQHVNFTPVPAKFLKAPLIQECPVNIECRVLHVINLKSHNLFIASVLAVHADAEVVDPRGEILLERVRPLSYESAIVREKPADDDWKPRKVLKS